MTDTINLSGIVDVPENATYNNVVINLGSAAVTLESHGSSGGFLTIGSAATLNVNGVVFDDLEGYTIVNDGRINVAKSLVVDDTTFINSGSVSLASRGALLAEGVLNLDGTTLVLKGNGGDLPGSGGYFELYGTLADGTFGIGNATLLSNFGTFDDITYKGSLFLNAGYDQFVYVTDGFRVEPTAGPGPGIISIGTGGGIFAEDDETFNNVVISLGSYDELGGVDAVTFGSAATIDAPYPEDELVGKTVVNDGQINTAGGTFHVNPGDPDSGAFTNAGKIDIGSSGVFSFLTQSFVNTGLVSIAANGELQVPYASIVNTGRVEGGGTVEGSLANAGTIEADGGTLDITGAIGGTGKLVIDATATLELDGTTAEAVDFSGVSTLKLETPTGYTGTLGGVTYGDAIDIASTTVSSATLSGTSLLVTLGGGATLDVALAGTLANGAVTVTSDGGSGSDITFTQAANSPALLADFSTMNFIAPAASSAPAEQSGVAALADNAVFADGFKPVAASARGALTGLLGNETFSAAIGLHGLIGQREHPSWLPLHLS